MSVWMSRNTNRPLWVFQDPEPGSSAIAGGAYGYGPWRTCCNSVITQTSGQSVSLGLRSPNKSNAMVEPFGVSRPFTIGNDDLMFDGLMEILIRNGYR